MERQAKNKNIFIKLNFKVHYTIKLDGETKVDIINENPTQFKDVAVYASDNFHDAPDASYGNLMFENIGKDQLIQSSNGLLMQ